MTSLENRSSNNKQALLIGAMGGLGSETINHLVKNSWVVYAADSQKEVLTHYTQDQNITPLQMDITSMASIEDAYNLISGHTPGLDAIIHMAGVLKIGSLVELPESALEECLNTNLFGIYRVNRLFLPILMHRRGRIVVLSSEVGRQTAAPFNGIYSISKHALEAYSDALRRELRFLGIKVIKIQPGPFKTALTKNAEQFFTEAKEDSTYFKEQISRGITYLPKAYKNAHHPFHVAKTILKALESPSPKTAYPVKINMLRAILEFLPVKWADKLITKVLT
jgi:NAD(P)-dependent dehydrogenase (short-subunit alcohol dehydrogenase family)